MLANIDWIPREVYELRHQLHREPEPSGFEVKTAKTIVEFFRALAPDIVIENLGGTGVAIVFGKPDNGQTLLLRCELDALRIEEVNAFAHRSIVPGVSHKCGHDGHMATLCAVGRWLSENRPQNGRVVLLFQPAEENGEGAKQVLADPAFEQIKPDMAFAFHNLPGFPLGQVVVRNGVFAAASRGMCISLHGSTAHAAQPNTGASPIPAVQSIIDQFSAMTDLTTWDGRLPIVTVVGCQIGRKDFGVAPGSATVWATLRTETDAAMGELVRKAETIVNKAAYVKDSKPGVSALTTEMSYEEIFNATVNSDRMVDIVRSAASDYSILEIESPFRWSEDFGRFSKVCETALFGIGAGENTPALHDCAYDFPDDLIPIAAHVFVKVINSWLNIA